jgi:hypothetical protein
MYCSTTITVHHRNDKHCDANSTTPQALLPLADC